MKDYSKEELEKISTLYDKFGNNISKKALLPRTFNDIKVLFSKILEKNREKLQTNIMGRQVTISAKDEAEFLDILDIKHSDVEEAIKESQYFQKFGELRLTSQLAFAFPLIILAAEYTKLKKIEEAKLCYLITFIKPYASREFVYFGKYGVNEDQMLYTVENLSERFDLKRLGTIFDCLVKMSTNSYENYLTGITKTQKLTDRELHVIYTSGVTSRVNNFIAGIASAYKDNKGKYLSFEDNSVKYENEDGADVMMRDIASDAALKSSIVAKALVALNKNPINTQLLKLACAESLGSTSQSSMDLLRDLIINVTDNMADKMEEFFSAMIGSFLFTDNPNTGKKYTMNDFRTIVFIAVMKKKVYSSPNSKDLYVLKVRDLLNQMLENYCDEYLTARETKKRLIKNALFFYWILLLQKAGR